MDQKFFPKRKQLGNFGEKIAKKFLESKKYKILGQNFYVQGGEIDIIAEKDDILVFVEVKTRTGKTFGEAALAMTGYKKYKLLRAIAKYLDQNGRSQPWRLDLISIDIDGIKKTALLKHFSDTFAK